MKGRKHVGHGGWQASNLPADDLDEDMACECEPVTHYVSQATGRRVIVHRSPSGDAPPAGALAAARRRCDMPDTDNPEDYL